jgi:glycosyltransferase involved in cell wall biosynthesis
MTGSADLAFVACNRNRQRFRTDPSFTHRCENMALALQARGIQSELLHFTSLPWSKRFKIVVFHRPRRHPLLNFMYIWLRWLGTTLVADIDDLVFDESYAGFSPAFLNGRLTLRQVQQQFRSHRRALAEFDRITVSTEPLAEHARRCFPESRLAVVPNGVPWTWKRMEEAASNSPSEPVILYLPGTPSHDRDFGIYAPAVTAFLAEHPQARLEITGPLRFSLSARTGQVICREKVPFEVYHECFRRGWVNLAPLEETPFTSCKSALKVLEAGSLGVPTICSPIPDAERFLGAGALFARDSAACLVWLEASLNPDRYRSLRAGLRKKVLAVADMEPIAKRFGRFVGILPPREH